MNFRNIKALTLGCALAGALAMSAAAQPSQTFVDFGTLSGESAAIQKGSGDLTPSVDESNVNDYRWQDEQLNLDPNAGNVRVLRTNQKALVNDFVTKAYPVKNVDTREIRNVLRTILGLEGGRAEVIKDKEAGAQFVQVICPKFMIPYLDRAIPALDETWVREYDTGSGDVYYKAKNRNAADIDRIAERYASEQGFSSVDSTNNAVSRIDEPYRIENYLKAAAACDIPANQVLLEVKIVEIAANNDLKIGFDFINWKNGPGADLAQFLFTGVDAGSTNEVFSSIFDPFINPEAQHIAARGNTVKYDSNYDASYRAINYLLTSNFIDFLEVKGQARVVQNNKLMVKSANTASISAEDEVVAIVSSHGDPISAAPSDDSTPGITNVDATRTSGHHSDETSTLTSEDGVDREISVHTVPARHSTRKLHYTNAGKTGITVSLTPFVGLESMELVADIQIGDMNGLSPNGTPIINARTLSTTVRLLDGEPYVIGGLKRTHDVKESNKVPLLGDIPVLGYLFGQEQDVKRTNDVLIVITPHFILSSQPDVQTTQYVADLAKVVSGKGESKLPKTEAGYDQWLFDN